MGTGNLEREIAAWLQTVAALDEADTARSATIVPRTAATGARALEVLRELAGRSVAGSGQLRQGDVIGEGGMGVVRLAEQVVLGRTVAVKTLKPGRRDHAAALDLLREAWVTGSLEHPNIVPVHYIGLEDDGNPVIVLKRIEGESWHDLIVDADAVRDRFGVTDLLAWNLGILQQVLNAVRFAHSRGILHRDLKPANVMIGQFGEVYLVDWGVAVSLRDDGTGRLPLAADATEIAGTPCYMAPEMIGRERGELSERTDVYLAGAVLYEIVAGQPPHQGDSPLALVESIAASRPAIPPGTPPELARIIEQAMHADPAQRYESADALRLAIQGFLEHAGSGRLAAIAAERLAQLEAAIADGAPRDEIYRLFGACKFGFHEALVVWRDNQEARDGVVRATAAVASYELPTDPRAAVSLLCELDAPPPELLARARAAAVAAASRQAELERMGREHDVLTGTRTRMFLAVILGTIVTIAPLVSYFSGGALGIKGYPEMATWSAGLLCIVVALGVWARDSLMKTAINRRLLASTVGLFGFQIVLAFGGAALEIPIVTAQVLMVLIWATFATMIAIGIDARLAPCGVAYALAFLASAIWPDERHLAMAGSNLVFLVTAAWVWRPASIRWTAEERAARGLPPRR